MNKYGLKIKNISAGSLYECNLGVREYFQTTDAVFHNSLFSDFIRKHGLKDYKGESTKDIVCLKFDFGSRSYEDERKRILRSIKTTYDEEYRLKLYDLLDKVDANKDKYVKKSREAIREEYYKDGVDITWNIRNKDGTIKKSTTIHYRMLYRTSAKAKLGQVMFINEKLYDKAHKWMTMGLCDKLPEHGAKIVELSAYAPLTTSTIVDRIHIPVEDILILKDKDTFIQEMADIVYAEDNEHDNGKHCAVRRDMTDIKSTIWDGMALVDKSLFGLQMNGMMLLRNHFFKACGFKTDIKLFFKDWCKEHGEDYGTYEVEDMYGVKHRLKDVKVITTDDATKWKKFADQMGKDMTAAYRYWCKRINADGSIFGIVKTDHPSKLGAHQQVSYQMINTLPTQYDGVMDILSDTINYIAQLKNNDEEFIKYLKKNRNDINHYDMMIDLYNRNPDFSNSNWFKNERRKIIRSYIRHIRTGKAIVDGDNLTMCGNPYALLLYSVGEDWMADPTLNQTDGYVEVYTTRFDDGEFLCGFRSPHNSVANIASFKNKRSKLMERYFKFSKNIIAVNCINSSIQSRLNGADFDGDMCLVTNQPEMVLCAKWAVQHCPTIVNSVEESGIVYDNTPEAYALMDNTFAKAQLGIGWSSNVCQLAMTYYWTELSKGEFADMDKVKLLYDNCTILSVIAQIVIDGCKKVYSVNAIDDIKRIQKMECMTWLNSKGAKKDFPEFMKYTRAVPFMKNGKERSYEDIQDDKNKLNRRINYELVCPMNDLQRVIDNIDTKDRERTIDTIEFLNLREHTDSSTRRYRMSKIRKLANALHDFMKQQSSAVDTDDKYLYVELIAMKMEEVIQQVKSISKNDEDLFNRMIEICIGCYTNLGGSLWKQQRAVVADSTIILNLLYKSNKDLFLKQFTMP